MSENGTNIGDAVRGLLASIEHRDPEMVASARTAQAWKMAANDAQRSHTDAVYTVPKTGGSEVVIYVDTNIWATELNLQCEVLRLKMNIALQEIFAQQGFSGTAAGDPERIKKLRFAASKDRYRGRRSDDITVEDQILNEGMHIDAQPVALTASEEADLQQQVAHIENPVIRRAALDAMRADLELKKGMQCAKG